ncbi:sigma-70 family RNA polymerase sigma factor [Micromonospora kangleipakensis]|uniref:sigma-70 family RNA polymerase sigma factor n=1 Tax=Micromonospora kangleipakensis TaxID=1077942 RepID=UPI0030FE1FA5
MSSSRSATSRWRRIGLRELLTSAVPDPAGPDTTDGVVVRDELLTALDRLPVRMRTVLVLRYWEDLPEAEVAAVMACSVGTVKSQAARGLARLRNVLASASASTGRSTPTGRVIGERA